jgi:diguanylate cyclase (GGDEF)-like protein
LAAVNNVATTLFLVIPTIFGLIALALAMIAISDRAMMSARWGALGFAIGGIGLSLDVLRPINDLALLWLAASSAYGAILCIAQAFASRHGCRLPATALLLSAVMVLILSPVSPLLSMGSTRTMVHQAATGLLFAILTSAAWKWPRTGTVDHLVRWSFLAVTLMIPIRLIFLMPPFYDPASLQSPLQSMAVAIFQATTAVAGMLLAFSLLLGICVDAFGRQRRQLHQDSLTRVGNRLAFDSAVAAHRAGDQLAGGVIALDIDHFKQVNDRYGHLAGDQVLERVGFALIHIFRDFGRIFRTGGEEFVILLDPDQADALAPLSLAVRKAVSGVRIAVDGGELNVTASIGFHRIGRDDSIDDAIDRADRAVYRAKAEGRDRVVHAVAKDGAVSLQTVA